MTRLALIACVACGPVEHRGEWHPGPPPSPKESFAVLGTDPPQLVDLVAERKPYQIALVREPSGVDADLHAIAIADDARAIAVGDRGTIVARTATGAWHRELAPTDHALHAIAVALDAEYAVGDAGTIVARHGDAWVVEPSGVDADLHAVVVDDERILAAGDHGTIVERVAGTWTPIATHGGGDLRAFDGHVAVGLAGAVVDCMHWDREQRQLAHRWTCVPRLSPTPADLLVLIDGRVLGTNGTQLRETAHMPVELVADAALPGAPTIRAGKRNHWLTDPQLGDVFAGDGGLVMFGDRPVTIAGAPDLAGIDFRTLDGFAVGAHGTIIHMQTRGVTIPKIELL